MEKHGSYELKVNNNIVTLKAYDAWNYETITAWGKDFKNIVMHMNNKPWACLVDLTEWELGTPDGRSYLYDLHLWLNSQNLKCLAIVCALSIQKEVLEEIYRILTNVDREYFESIDEAVDWLSSVGFKKI